MLVGLILVMRSSPVQVRPADDIEQSLLEEIFISSRADAGCYADRSVEPEHFAGLIDGEEVHIAEVGGQVVGFVSVWVSDSFIHHLYVLPQFQGQGVGSSLLRACEEKYHLPLSLKCDVCNLRAHRFYKNKGWIPRERGVGEHGAWERLNYFGA